jgi:hypothetical protein
MRACGSVAISIYPTQIRKIIIVRIIPGITDLHIRISFARPERPALIQGIITIHQMDVPVGPPQFRKNIILAYVFAPFASVRQINGALRGAEMQWVKFYFRLQNLNAPLARVQP